ncbi:MAG: polyisoprenoid-binding protein [Nitrospirae bacterium]|nr:polyisoprenoid-binding protein [Nitrospirota bacterium]MBI3352970.1 polyisoprenoid-binding protein [Nitrospirota bacterium]
MIIIGCLLMFSPAGHAAEYTIDPAHSHAGFQVRHVVSKLQGEFKDFEGAFTFDEKKPEISKGKFTIMASSINTNHEKRDTHLKSPDFFDTEKFPTLSFESKKITPSGGKKYALSGDLSIHGIKRQVMFEVEYLGADKDPWGNRRAGFSATTKINRKDYGIVWNKILDSGGLLVGDEVDINMQVEAIEKK